MNNPRKPKVISLLGASALGLTMAVFFLILEAVFFKAPTIGGCVYAISFCVILALIFAKHWNSQLTDLLERHPSPNDKKD